MFELDLPRFEFDLESGVRALQDGFVVMFFLPGSHSEVASAVGAAVDVYLSLPGIPQQLGMLDEEGYPLTLGIGDVRTAIAPRLDASLTQSGFAIIDSPDHVSSFSVRYYGFDLADREASGWPNAVSGLRFTFPTDYLGETGLLELFNAANRLAAVLPFSFAYVSPAFLYLEGIGEPGAFEVIRGVSKRYPCLDIPAILPDTFEVGSGPKGAYWGTYLSRDVIERLGGEARVRNYFAGYDVEVMAREHGSVSVYLGPAPISGDVNRQEDVSLYRIAFSLYSELILPRDVAYMNFDEETMREWLYRFSDDDGG